MSRSAEKLKAHSNDVFSTEDLEKILGNREAINLAVESGLIEKLSRGFYGVEAPIGNEAVAVASKYYPDAVICGHSALFIQGLSDYDPAVLHLSFPRETAMLAGNDLFQFHRLSEKRNTVGVETITMAGRTLKILGPERCLFEVAKHGPNSEEFVKAMRFYFEKFRLDKVKVIIELGQTFKGQDIIMSALQTMSLGKGLY